MAELAEREAAALAALPFIARIPNQRAPDPNTAVSRIRTDMRQEMARIFGGGDDTAKAYAPRTPRDEQRARADKVAHEFELERALTFDRRA